MKLVKGTIKIEFDSAERGTFKDVASILDDVITHMNNCNCDQLYLDELGGHHIGWLQDVQEFFENLADDENEIF